MLVLLKNAPILAIVAVDTAENGPSKVCPTLPKPAKKAAPAPEAPQLAPAAAGNAAGLEIWQILADFGRFWQTLDGPFSAVSTATIARIGAFCSFFKDLQD